MRIRHIPLYGLVAGALVVSVLIFGGGGGVDAATGAVSDAVHHAVTRPVPTPGASRAVVVQPDTVAPGDTFSVYDGGNCRGEPAEASFGGADIPALPLSSLSSQNGGTAVLPEGIAPGAYPVTVTCGATGGDVGRAEPGGAGDQQRVTDHGTAERAPGQGEEGGEHRGGADRRTFTGTLTVSDAGDGVVPRGGSDTGLGGAAHTGSDATALGGVLLLGAAGWGVLTRRRRTRGPRD
ncbi:hypothetical protein ACWD6P_35415 [Streptomyces sp. NPDC002446]